eukprot:3047898-Rhodomonas_salina.1
MNDDSPPFLGRATKEREVVAAAAAAGEGAGAGWDGGGRRRGGETEKDKARADKGITPEDWKALVENVSGRKGSEAERARGEGPEGVRGPGKFDFHQNMHVQHKGVLGSGGGSGGARIGGWEGGREGQKPLQESKQTEVVRWEGGRWKVVSGGEG